MEFQSVVTLHLLLENKSQIALNEIKSIKVKKNNKIKIHPIKNVRKNNGIKEMKKKVKNNSQ